MKIKKRLDVLLTEQGYADTRSKAQAIIMSGQVYVYLMKSRYNWKSAARYVPM